MTEKRLTSMFHLARVRRILRALGIAVLLSASIVLVTDSESTSMIRAGDFPAFYSLAVIADSAEPERLYDLVLQSKIQNEVWPSMKGGVLPGAYPPFVAQFLRPLAWMGPVAGKALWFLVSFLSLLAFFLLLQRQNSDVKILGLDGLIALVLICPIGVAVAGAQNTTVSMLLYLLIVRLHGRRDRHSEITYGLVLGLWLFKPQYAILASLPALLAGRWIVMSVFGACTVLAYLAGAGLVGLSWPLNWSLFTTHFAELNFLSNAAQMTNLVGAARALASLFQLSPAGTTVLVSVAGAVCTVGIGLLVLSAAAHARRSRHELSPSPFPYFAWFGPVVTLFTPQTNFYDLGLAMVPLALIFRPERGANWAVYFAVVLACATAALARPVSAFPWFAVVSCAVLILTGYARKREGEGSAKISRPV